MSKWRNLAKRIPRFSIKDMLIVVACCAIGLSTQFDPFLGIASCFLLVELWWQWRFVRAQPPAESAELRSGLTWARIARVLCALFLALMMVHQMLLMRGALEIPVATDLLLVWTLPFELTNVLLLLALFLTCRGTNPPSHRYFVRNFLFGFLAVLSLVRMVTQELHLPFLVHRGVKGIEHARPMRLHRAGVYPDHAAEMYFSFWLGTVAAIALIVAVILLLLASRRVRQRQSVPIGLCFAFVSLLLFCLGYVAWFYGWEYYRLSPDLATAGFGAKWSDWLGGFLIALVIATGVSAVLSRTDLPESLRKDNSKIECIQPSLFGLLAVGTLLLSFAAFIWEFITVIIGNPSSWGNNPILDWIDILIAPPQLLRLSICLVAIQITWRWLRHGPPDICIAGMNAKAFAFNWVAVLLLFAIGVPLLNAFGFVFWLGPWSPY